MIRVLVATFALIIGVSSTVFAQQPAASESKQDSGPALSTGDHASVRAMEIPAGTQIPLRLRQAISTKSAKPGDAVYAETVFPVVLNDRIMIPTGTYVQGRISEVKRPGRVKGHQSYFPKRIYRDSSRFGAQHARIGKSERKRRRGHGSAES
jgi:hypothetical protein